MFWLGSRGQMSSFQEQSTLGLVDVSFFVNIGFFSTPRRYRRCSGQVCCNIMKGMIHPQHLVSMSTVVVCIFTAKANCVLHLEHAKECFILLVLLQCLFGLFLIGYLSKSEAQACRSLIVMCMSKSIFQCTEPNINLIYRMQN